MHSGCCETRTRGTSEGLDETSSPKAHGKMEGDESEKRSQQYSLRIGCSVQSVTSKAIQQPVRWGSVLQLANSGWASYSLGEDVALHRGVSNLTVFKGLARQNPTDLSEIRRKSCLRLCIRGKISRMPSYPTLLRFCVWTYEPCHYATSDLKCTRYFTFLLKN